MSEPLRVVVLGSTGSIGTQTLDVVRWRGWKVVGLAAGRNRALLAEQVRAFRPEVVYAAGGVPELPPGVRAAASAAEVAAWDADVVVAAIPGLAGLEPVRAAVRAGRRVALANKESMVAAGPLLQEEARKYGAAFVPVDSEHSALFQALAGERPEDVAELVLTASGGPFREGPEDLSGVTPEEALRHPRWSMGPKVTIDSATLMNKGLEVLEAHALFGTELERIKVVVHPQSYVHSLVRFVDGQIKAVLGPTDMRLAIQYALTYPERAPTPRAAEPLPPRLDFEPPDLQRFPALELAYRAGAQGGLAPTVLNAANEVAVEAFLSGRLGFTGIARVVESVLGKTPPDPLTWENLYAADAWARAEAEEQL
ncbi:1-deoxy-D-xylulose-5-phosphate reductoisomerase [Oceanithermus profundus]|uniref:1-deoxy-D-xylulose 5-phosphate reductoisomerase n=1 Tax=Oceanithermus profundus (strain DSM 14977 / NBRC 100410 / VKM B-2274 / 506) TaxID=670487 RepID=E4U7U8_OCEP5|nr:1-deoxy-D-xylulose-5-phosphate reductoisomerase [Oceanithermus profundus]ADR36547.1 1-deoxy-D-xylulose 5-phosphate reductoisomerase [Oceanithermus profundus DSM 14977]